MLITVQSAIIACAVLGTVELGREQGGAGLDGLSLVEFRVVMDEPADHYDAFEYDGETFYLDPDALIVDADLETVRPVVRREEFVLVFRMMPESGERFRQFTRSALGQRIAVIIDSRIYAVLTIRSEVGGELILGLELSDDERQAVVDAVRTRWPQ